MSQSWLAMTAADLGRGMEAGAIDPRALTEAYLDAIDRHAASPAIYARVTPARARAEAEASAARARAGLRRGPLDGVPVSWKDLFDTAGVATEAGSALLARPRAGRGRRRAGDGGPGGARLPRQDPHERARLLRPRGQPLDRDAAERQRCRARARRLVLRGGRLGRVRAGGGRHRVGHRRIGAGARRVERPRRAEDDARAPAPRRAWCRSARASTPSARWRGRSRTRASSWRRSRAGRPPTSPAPGLRGRGCSCSRPPLSAPSARRRAPPSRLRSNGSPPPERGSNGGMSPAPTMPSGSRPASSPARATASGGARSRRGRMRCSSRSASASGRAPPSRRRTSWRPGGGSTRCARPGGRRRRASTRVLMPTAANLPPNVERLLAEPEFFTAENLMALRNTRVANLMGCCALSLPTETPGMRTDADGAARGGSASAAARPRGGAGAGLSGSRREMLDCEGLAG